MVNLSERNKKVAINRWKKVLSESSEKFKNNSSKYPGLKARLIGYLIGDGSISIHKEFNGAIHHSIDFYPDDVFMLKSFLESFDMIYCARPRNTNLGKYFSSRISSKAIALDLLSITSFNSLDWKIPSFISIEEKRNF
jgi:hypothetical protein